MGKRENEGRRRKKGNRKKERERKNKQSEYFNFYYGFLLSPIYYL